MQSLLFQAEMSAGPSWLCWDGPFQSRRNICAFILLAVSAIRAGTASMSRGRHAFLMDAGTSTDGMDRVPDLTLEQIRSADYLFVTHSHRDHTGAIHFLEENGFTGQVLMSNQTYRQIHHKPLNTMILDSTAPELELSTDFRVIWGRTGHCAGAVWFLIEIEGKKLFFSEITARGILLPL